jgi:hypothetical protein
MYKQRRRAEKNLWRSLVRKGKAALKRDARSNSKREVVSASAAGAHA